MQTQLSYTADASQLAVIQRKLVLDNKIRGGANWFFWIAALSMINTIIYFTGSSINFVLGLGATQIIDVFMSALARDLGSGWSILRYIGIAIDLGIAAVFVLLGLMGRKRHRWPIIIGMVLYAIDGVILLLFKIYLGAAFHAWALYGIWTSLAPIKELDTLEKTGGTESIESLRNRLPSERLQITSRQRNTRLILIGAILLVLFLALVISSVFH
jgi:hypothetical protein